MRINTRLCKESLLTFLLPHALTLFLSMLYLELLLRLSSSLPLIHDGLPAALLCSLAFSCGFAALCTLPRKPSGTRLVCLLLLELVTVWYLIAYFTNDSYGVFMSPTMIARETGNVMKDFGGSVAAAVLNGLGVILLYHVPLLIALFLPKRRFAAPAPLKAALPLALVLTLLSAAGAWGLSNCTAQLRTEYRQRYTYDNAVRNFGLFSALHQELSHQLFPREVSFSFQPVSETPAPAVTPVPTEAPEPTETPAPTASPIPTETPALPEMPELTEVPVPTEAPEMGETPAPSAAPAVSEAPAPTGTPEPTPEPTPVPSGPNIMDLDFSRVVKPDQAVSLSRYIQSRTPTEKNRYTGMFKEKNLILITAESFARELIDPELTPTLYRMANKGIVFEDFYQPAWGGSTSTGEYSWLTGLAPTDPLTMMLSHDKNLYFTMGNQLQRLGYASHAYHNGSYDYYDRDMTHKNLGYSSYIGVGNGLEEGLTAGEFPHSDKEMIEFTLPQYIDEQPFSVYYMTISGHPAYAFSAEANDMAMKNRDVAENLPHSFAVNAYIACNLELEYAMESLIRSLEEAGIADDTVIALVPDHYPYGLSPGSAWGSGVDGITELFGYKPEQPWERDHNAAIIWCGALEKLDEPIRVSGPVSSLDILPTLSNLFGLDYDSRLLAGNDVLSDAERLVFWNDCSWVTEKGTYSAHGDVFTPAEGQETDKDYLERIHADVRNKINLSWTIEYCDYYRLLFGDDEFT